MKTLVKVLGVTVGVIVLLAVVAEVGLRWYIGGQVNAQFHEEVANQGVSEAPDADVAFGAKPLVLGLVASSVPQAEINLPETLRITQPQNDPAPQIAGTPAVHVTARGLDVSHPKDPVAQDFRATTRLPEDFLLAVVQQGLAEAALGGSGSSEGNFIGGLLRQLIKVTNVTADKTAGALDIEFTNGAAVLTMRPELDDGWVTFRVTNTTLFGIELPAEVSKQISAALEGVVREQAELARPLVIEDVRIIDDAAVVTVYGEDVALSSLASMEERVEQATS